MTFSGNEFTRQFGITLPIVQGPMGGIAGPQLVAAVANAGALGALPVWTLNPAEVQAAVAKTRRLTAADFALNFRADRVQVDQIRAAIEIGASIFHLFWGDPSASAGPIREAGAKLLCTVGDSDSAMAAIDAGADALIAQGVEAGGHVLSEMPLTDLLDTILAVAGKVPVVAAGGLATAHDVARAIGRGASGALLGTRFVATRESMAHEDYKQALLTAGADATARSECFDVGWEDAPHRHLVNPTYQAWVSAGRPKSGTRPGEGEIVLRFGDVEFPRYSVTPPRAGMTGEIRDAVMYAGTGVKKIADCPAAGAVVLDLVGQLHSSH